MPAQPLAPPEEYAHNCRRPVVQCSAFVLIEPLTLGELWRRCVCEPSSSVAWEQFLERTYPVLLRIARNTGGRWRVRSQEEIDDLVQDICLKLSQRARSVAKLPEHEEAMEAYLKAMAANAARDSLRARFAGKRGKDVTVSLEDRMSALTTQVDKDAPDRQVFLKQIEELLQGSARDQAVFWLYYRSGFTSKEIAAIPAFSLTSKGVESLLHRMTQSLRDQLGPS